MNSLLFGSRQNPEYCLPNFISLFDIFHIKKYCMYITPGFLIIDVDRMYINIQPKILALAFCVTIISLSQSTAGHKPSLLTTSIDILLRFISASLRRRCIMVLSFVFAPIPNLKSHRHVTCSNARVGVIWQVFWQKSFAEWCRH